ncbi:hypothetical protein P9112_000867 [Eukaryota sp. TZLM1-RC]
MSSKIRLVVLGSGAVGKSALTLQLVQGHFFEEYDPTIEDSYRTELVVDNQNTMLEILDTAGQEDFTGLRNSYLEEGHGFLFVYSIDNPQSLEEIAPLFEALQRVKGDEPVNAVIVGNKCDLEASGLRKVEKSEGEAFAKQRKIPFFETSAKECINVKESFAQVVREVKRVAPKKKGGCTLL